MSAFIYFFIFKIFRAASVAYVGSQARGRIGAAAAGLATATAMRDPSCICDLHHSSEQRRILNPLSGTRNRTCIRMDASRVCHPLSHSGNSCSVSQRLRLFCFFTAPFWSYVTGAFCGQEDCSVSQRPERVVCCGLRVTERACFWVHLFTGGQTARATRFQSYFVTGHAFIFAGGFITIQWV